MQNPILELTEHNHGDHSHIKMTSGKVYREKNGLNAGDEGCPCCAAGIDLDEIATAISEISKESVGSGANVEGVGGVEGHANLGGELANFTDPAHWGIFLGISGPLAVVGLTAAIRNVKGTINTRKKLNHVIDGLEKDIEKYKNEGNTSVVQRLEAFKNCLKHSKFDTDFNLVVPGVINGTASAIVLSSAVWHSPWALPVIGAYSACQTGKNLYELIHTWNRTLPESLAIKPLEVAGVKKVNQITKSKRRFYSANALGFAVFTVGAIILTLAVTGVIPGLGALIAGIVLLAVGTIATGIMNNIWTNKFKPRNGNLGVDRKILNAPKTLEEIGKRREVKKILKTYRKKHLPYSAIDNLKRFGCKALTSLPFCEKKSAKLLHKINISKCDERNYMPFGTLSRERLELLESIVQVAVPNFQFNKDENDTQKVFRALKELELEGVILEKFVAQHILKTTNYHDTSIKNLESYKTKLLESGFFNEAKHKHRHNDEHHSHNHKHLHLEFNLDALEQNPQALQNFMNTLEQHLMFEYVEKLRYEQYGLNDYFWQVEKHKEQWERTPENLNENKINLENVLMQKKAENFTHKKHTELKHHRNHHHSHSHEHECCHC